MRFVGGRFGGTKLPYRHGGRHKGTVLYDEGSAIVAPETGDEAAGMQ